MPNTYRGETPFRALGREMFLVYRTQEIAAMQAALGFCRPEPLVKPTAEQVPALNLRKNGFGQLEHVLDVDSRALAALDAEGSPTMRTVIVDVKERRRRMVEAFDAAYMSPMASELLVMVRCGLGPWERDNGKLTDREFEQLCEDMGFAGLNQLHQESLQNSIATMLPAAESDGEGDDPNAKSPESASQT